MEPFTFAVIVYATVFTAWACGELGMLARRRQHRNRRYKGRAYDPQRDRA